MMKVVILVVALLAALCAGQGTPIAMTQDEMDTLVALHNNARAGASPTPAAPLQSIVWDANIAADAQTWVNQCNIKYSPNYSATKYGENPIYFTQGFDVTTAFNYWMQEKNYYSFTGTGYCSTYTCINFQQIMAANTYSMGCAKSSCNINGETITWFVCDYKSFWQYNALPYTPAGSSGTKAPTSPPSPTRPTRAPTNPPATLKPTGAPTSAPTHAPSGAPSTAPTRSPSNAPSGRPTASPSMRPTIAPTTPPVTSKPTNSAGYPTVDYRGTKLVTAVHNQGQCGSCWAFSTTAIIEGAVGTQTGSLSPTLSDQDTLDCSGGGGDCQHGGWPVSALQGMIKQGHMNSQAAYPYVAVQGTCKYNAGAGNAATITKTGTVKGDFASVYNALVTYGPIGIAVDASAWSNYRSGVMSSDSNSINHAVTLVGYDATLNAWIIKNSWGSTWGQSGYIYLDVAHSCGAQINGAWWAQ